MHADRGDATRRGLVVPLRVASPLLHTERKGAHPGVRPLSRYFAMRWINRPLRSLGSNHVDLGGMSRPASATASS